MHRRRGAETRCPAPCSRDGAAPSQTAVSRAGRAPCPLPSRRPTGRSCFYAIRCPTKSQSLSLATQPPKPGPLQIWAGKARITCEVWKRSPKLGPEFSWVEVGELKKNWQRFILQRRLYETRILNQFSVLAEVFIICTKKVVVKITFINGKVGSC